MAANHTAILTSLLRDSTIEDHEEVLRAADAVLKSSKNNPDALHTKIVALLKLDRFDDALRTLDAGGDRLAERCALEKAYALYKSGQLSEAETILQRPDKRGLGHIAAQVAYRAERFDDAAKIYKQLNAEPALIEGEENDLRINSAAVDAQLEWQGNGDKVEAGRKQPGREDLEAFETSYNAACGCIARGDLAKGSILLKRARDLCEALDELTDEEKRTEVLPIMVQQAYVFTRLGKSIEAESIEKMINISDVPEPPTRVIAQNNALAASTDENPYTTQRLFDSVPTLLYTERHFDHQARILQRNRYAIDLQSQKYSGVAYSTMSIISKSPSPTTSPFVNSLAALNAAAYAHGESGTVGLKKILPLLENRPNDVGLILTIIQLHILTNNPGPAITLLETFFNRLEASSTDNDLDVRYAPGLIAVLVSLYCLSGRKIPIKTELGKAASYWRQKSKPSSNTLLRAAGVSLLESSKLEDLNAAGEIFSSLRKQDHNDRTAVAGYVASYATADIQKVSADLEKLTPISRLVSGIDAAALESAGVPSLGAPAAVTASKKRTAEADTNKKESVPKKRKIPNSKRPKDFVEGKEMDAERWLPLRDRSSYKPKGKKGKKKAMEMTQGGLVKEAESLELAGGAGSVPVQKASGGGGNKNKKKGKGKK